MTNLYLAEKDMYNRMADKTRVREQKDIYELAAGHSGRPSGGLVSATALEVAGRLGRVADNVQSWFAGPRVAERAG